MAKKIYRIKCDWKTAPLKYGHLNEVFEATDAINAIDQFRRDWIRAKTEDDWDVEYTHITDIKCEYVGTIVEGMNLSK